MHTAVGAPPPHTHTFIPEGDLLRYEEGGRDMTVRLQHAVLEVPIAPIPPPRPAPATACSAYWECSAHGEHGQNPTTGHHTP